MAESRTKVTVLRVFKPEEVLEGNTGVTNSWGNKPCSKFKKGQEVVVVGGKQLPLRPEGFCGPAWQVLYPYILTIHCGGNFAKWVKEPGKLIISCPDGSRPVVFKLERLPPES